MSEHAFELHQGPGANSSVTRSTLVGHDSDSEADGDSPPCHSSSSHAKTNPDPDDHPSLTMGPGCDPASWTTNLAGLLTLLTNFGWSLASLSNPDSDSRVGLLKSAAASSSPSHRPLPTNRRHHPLTLTLCHELMGCVLGGAFAVTLALLQLAQAPAVYAGRCLLCHAGGRLLCDAGGRRLLCDCGLRRLGYCFSWRVVERLQRVDKLLLLCERGCSIF